MAVGVDLDVDAELLFEEVVSELAEGVFPETVEVVDVFDPHDDGEVEAAFGGDGPPVEFLFDKVVDEFAFSFCGHVLVDEVDAEADVAEFEGVDDGVEGFNVLVVYEAFDAVGDDGLGESDLFAYLGEGLSGVQVELVKDLAVLGVDLHHLVLASSPKNINLSMFVQKETIKIVHFHVLGGKISWIPCQRPPCHSLVNNLYITWFY